MAKILVIEDDGHIRKMIKDFLRTQTHDVDEAYGALSGIEKIKKNKYDLIISDNRMPGVSGLNIIGIIKQLSNAPLILMSGEFSKEEVIEGHQKGANKIMVKPFNMGELDSVVVDCLYAAMNNKAG